MKPNCIVLKLKTGETIFAELLRKDPNSIEIVEPFSAFIDDKDGLSLIDWLPFSTKRSLYLNNADYFYCGELNKKYIKFYGSVVLQSHLNRIKETMATEMGHSNDYYTILEWLDQMKSVIKELSDKFELDEDELDLSKFEEHLKKHKPVSH